MSIRAIVRALLAVVALLLAAPAACVLMTVYDSATRYDRNSADYRYIASVLQKSPPHKLDLGRINGGDWQFVCVIGGYNDPVKILSAQAERRRIAVGTIDPVKAPFLGLSPVEENEGAISFVDRAGRGRTVLIGGFERLAGQHARKCFGSDVREVTLPVNEIER